MRLVIVAVLAMSVPAFAEPTRAGLMLGGSMGPGRASACGDCSTIAGGAAELHIGGWVTPRWALGYEMWMYVDNDGISPTGVGASMAVVTAHVAPRMWVKGGTGFALYSADNAFAQQVSYPGLGVGAGVGYELYQSPGSLVIDVGARPLVSWFPDHGTSVAGSVLAGVTWN